jgi:phage shock protein A
MLSDGMIKSLFERAESIKTPQLVLEKEVALLEAELEGLIDSMDSLKSHLRDIQSKPQTEAVQDKPRMSEEDFRDVLERLLHGSLEELGDRISQRILDKLKDIKGLSGRARETGIRELKEMAGSELVNLSRLFNQEVKSNIHDIGVEEKETKGIGEGLSRLREMRRQKGGERRGG